jgi:hypothetical protein
MMGCNCRVFEIIVAIVVLVFAFWQTAYSKWILVIAAIALILHALICKNCAGCMPEKDMKMHSMKKSSKKKRR